MRALTASMSTSAREITITRVFDAPRERVWRAWTEPAEIARWWGKRGWNTPVESVELDVRPGGAFRLNSIAETDGAEMPLEAVYREVVAPERLVFGEPGRREESTVTFPALGDGRTEMVLRTMIPSDRAEAGLASALDRLGDVVGQAASATS